ncbi:hypothetical protein SapgrDRAFT_0977 [Saprospira grandis DSM 2844]|uniref:Rhs family protein n=1 Tax=Saprospira grandis DSM 2844 TaxID=694433 RepID=J0XUT0_9BACT|nr:hypothetical protein [Saprospira grandis]EJF52706.1 hypothetical protein SapgrDRAFT_0977 [Saprospira grandis DSM 2844]
MNILKTSGFSAVRGLRLAALVGAMLHSSQVCSAQRRLCLRRSGPSGHYSAALGRGFALLLFLALLPQLLLAQKPQIKFLQQKHYVPALNKGLELQTQTEKYFNEYGAVTREEYFKMSLDSNLNSQRKIIHSYDSRGRHQNSLHYNGDNLLEREVKIYWDQKNNKNKIEEISYVDGQQASVAITYLLTYDEAGNKEVEQYFNTKGIVTRQRNWFYNKQEEVIRSLELVEEPNQPRKEIKTRYKRDQDGYLTKSITVEKVNGKLFRKDIRYFENSFLIRWKKYIEGKFVSEFVNEYRDSVLIRQTENERFDREKKRKRSKKESIWVTNTEYDVYGNILVQTKSRNEQVVSIVQYAYDDYGNRIKTIKINRESNEKEEERLTYDKWGNVASLELLKNDRIVHKDEFIYEYHPRKRKD